MANIKGHWAKSKKHNQSIGQLDFGFQRLLHVVVAAKRVSVTMSAPPTTNLLSHLTAASSSQKGFGAYSPTRDTVVASTPVNPTGGWKSITRNMIRYS